MPSARGDEFTGLHQANERFFEAKSYLGLVLTGFHPEIQDFRIKLSAVSGQDLANPKMTKGFAES